MMALALLAMVSDRLSIQFAEIDHKSAGLVTVQLSNT